MRITITKGENEDRLHIVRSDGSAVSTRFAHKGPIPHDFVHLAVEQRLGLNDAFWGKVDGGAHPEALAELARMGGHASAKRASVPDPAIAQMVQSERMVECFEADLWSGGGARDGIRHMAEAGWAQSCVEPLPLSDDDIDAIRADIAAFGESWRAMPPGESVTLDWAVPR